jgi:tetratricopeptide (TPR) repeat protein
MSGFEFESGRLNFNFNGVAAPGILSGVVSTFMGYKLFEQPSWGSALLSSSWGFSAGARLLTQPSPNRKSRKSAGFFLLALTGSLLLAPLSLSAQEPQHHHDVEEKLGTLTFATSCAPAVQSQFERGVALLHSFEYEVAQAQFEEVAKQDPRCAMADWGEAMTLYHELWDRPTEADLAQGAQLLAKARSIKRLSDRERDYIQALSVFYSATGKLDHNQRAAAYAKAMQGVYERNPNDHEAAVFYALSLLASSPDRDPNLTNAKAAVAILNKLYDEQPNHPGIAHYIIHSCDNPAMASLALPAARKYASIAPSSPHAVHMPSHIFARLGLWQDDINSNLAAIRVADSMAAHHHVMHHKVHALDFLEYAYMQIGDDASAKAAIEQVAAVRPEGMDHEFENYLLVRQAEGSVKFALERRQWKEALALQPISGAPSEVQSVTYWGRAVAAGHLHDAAAAKDALKHYGELLEATRKGPRPYLADGLKNEHQIVQAWAAYAGGNSDEALRLLRIVADDQDRVGKAETELPAREMLADMLLDLHRPQDALKEYEVSLGTDPNRFNGLYGAAQAAAQVQQTEKASEYYTQLLKNCESIHSDRPELAEARKALASVSAAASLH